MEDYKIRMIEEYYDLKDKHGKLHKMLVKADAGTMDFTPTCPIGLLREQEDVMCRYLRILEVRAEIEKIDFDTFENEKGKLAEFLNGFSREWNMTHDTEDKR